MKILVVHNFPQGLENKSLADSFLNCKAILHLILLLLDILSTNIACEICRITSTYAITKVKESDLIFETSLPGKLVII